MQETGASIEVADEDGLAEAVAWLLDDPGERTRHMEAATAFAGNAAHVLEDVMAEIRPFLDALGNDQAPRAGP